MELNSLILQILHYTEYNLYCLLSLTCLCTKYYHTTIGIVRCTLGVTLLLQKINDRRFKKRFILLQF